MHKLARYLSQRDRRLMDGLSRWSPPRLIRLWMISSSRAGDGWLWVLLGVPILWFGGEQRYRVLAALSLAVVAGAVVFSVVKRVAVRHRPCSITPVHWVKMRPGDRFSFPSGHSVTAFAITVPLSLFYPAYVFGLMFCALSVASSRVVLGLHFLSDVVIGSMMGAGIGYAVYSLLC